MRLFYTLILCCASVAPAVKLVELLRLKAGEKGGKGEVAGLVVMILAPAALILLLYSTNILY